MYQPNYYTLSFMMRSAHSTRTGEAPIYARITVSGQRAEFNINRNVDPENWNTAKGMSKGRSKRDIELNKYLESIRVEKAREFDPFGHAGFDPTGIIRLTP